MQFNNTEVFNFKGAFRGLRNPLESWKKSDSRFGIINIKYDEGSYDIAESYATSNGYDPDVDYEAYDEAIDKTMTWLEDNGILRSGGDGLFDVAFIGPNDLDLAKRMIAAGPSDSKFLRQIFVSVDITAPLYWWKELDTYKIGTTANSTSTMHKLASTPITIDCFEIDDYQPDLKVYDNEPYRENTMISDCWDSLIDICETLRRRYLETKDKRYWKELVRILPNGWMQTRTWTTNYAALRNMYHQRKNHKLTEWHSFCQWVESLPYAKELIID